MSKNDKWNYKIDSWEELLCDDFGADGTQFSMARTSSEACWKHFHLQSVPTCQSRIWHYCGFRPLLCFFINAAALPLKSSQQQLSGSLSWWFWSELRAEGNSEIQKKEKLEKVVRVDLKRHPTQKVWTRCRRIVDPRFEAGLPFPEPEILEFRASRKKGEIFLSIVPGIFTLRNTRRHPTNSHSVLEFAEKTCRALASVL